MQSFQPWSRGEPNGHENENCAVIDSIKNSWDDVSCSKEYCPVCIVPKLLSFVLRGLCQYSHFDTHYAWATDKLSDSPEGLEILLEMSKMVLRLYFIIILILMPFLMKVIIIH